MGILTDPNPGLGRFTIMLLQTRDRLCALLYITGVVWFFCLAHKQFNNATYFSENALLPGLVRGEFDADHLAVTLQEELKRVQQANPSDVPYSWLRARFSQMHLDSYLHNYTVNYPLGAGAQYYGRNVYSVLRAPRASSLEGIVLSTPFRTLDSTDPDNTAGVAMLLAIAQFCRRHKYWAKDIVFLITDNEQLGTQAWLEAYHDVKIGSGALNAGQLEARAGSLQAAVNIELHSLKLSHIDVKVEGLNGQLPNLDLVNLVHRLSSKEGIRHTFKNRTNPRKKDTPYEQWKHSLTTLMNMVLTQASCVPSGSHGLYHRFGIEAVTLEGHSPGPNYKSQVSGAYQTGRVLEGILRSLNNLLERFHQSYFFYLMPANDRFISIGLYMPVVGLIGAPLLIKALAIWMKIYNGMKTQRKSSPAEPIWAARIGWLWLCAHVIGVGLVYGAPHISQAGFYSLGLNAQNSIYLMHVVVFAASLFFPALFRIRGTETDALMIIALLQLTTVLLAIAMQNFSLAFLAAAVIVPVVLSVSPTTSKGRRVTQSLGLLLVHPLSLLHWAVLVYTAIYLDMTVGPKLFSTAFTATQSFLVFSLVDGLVYGNWFQEAVFSLIIPCWLMFWVLAHSRESSDSSKEEHLKTD